MDDRRKIIGRRIRVARSVAGYRSQKIFADAIGISPDSVGQAERGDPRVGTKTYARIEDALDWPVDSIAKFLETGDEGALDPRGLTRAVEAVADYNERIGQLPESKQALVDQLIQALSIGETDREHGKTDGDTTRDGADGAHQHGSVSGVLRHLNGPRKRDAQ